MEVILDFYSNFRAGRCQPGVCYHMMSTVRFGSLIAYPAPEILRYPLQVYNKLMLIFLSYLLGLQKKIL